MTQTAIEARSRRAGGRRVLHWIVGGMVLLVLIGAVGWFTATRAQSVATLDSADALFTRGSTAMAAGPVSFGPHPQQKLFVHVPQGERGDAALPVLVFIHGGSWRSGDPEPYAYVARNLAPEGYVVVLAGYRLGEDGRFPAMLQDGAAALRWVRGNIADYGGDPARIAVMGHSAGAYNAMMLALDPQWLAAEGLGGDTIDAAIGIAGPYDFLPLDSDSTKAAFGHARPLETTQPVNFARADAPPVLLMTGSADETVRPGNVPDLARALKDAGAAPDRIDPRTFDAMGHIGIVMALSTPFAKGGEVKQEILRFLAGNLPDAPVRQRQASAAVQAENE